jgi:hypothetical protein
MLTSEQLRSYFYGTDEFEEFWDKDMYSNGKALVSLRKINTTREINIPGIGVCIFKLLGDEVERVGQYETYGLKVFEVTFPDHSIKYFQFTGNLDSWDEGCLGGYFEIKEVKPYTKSVIAWREV